MSGKFHIHKTGDRPFPWAMDYPRGFSKPGGPIGEACSSFEIAVATFIAASEMQCPTCLRGAVVDTEWGWECKACGSYDVASGHERPAVSCE